MGVQTEMITSEVRRLIALRQLVAIALMVLSLPVWALAGSGAEFGCKVGGNSSSVYGQSRDDRMKPKLGLCVGGYVALPLNPNVTFQSELMLTTRSFNRSYVVSFFSGQAEFTETDKLTWLELPVLLKFPFGPNPGFRPALYFGASASVRIGSKASAKYTLSPGSGIPDGSFSSPISNSRAFSLGPLAGVETAFRIKPGMVGHADIRLGFGLMNMFKDDELYFTDSSHKAPVVDLANGKALKLKPTNLSVTFAIGWN